MCSVVVCVNHWQILHEQWRQYTIVLSRNAHMQSVDYTSNVVVMFVLTQYGICYKNAQRKFKQMIVREKQIMVSIARVIVKQFAQVTH